MIARNRLWVSWAAAIPLGAATGHGSCDQTEPALCFGRTVTCATRLLSNGTPVHGAAAFLGHDPAITWGCTGT
jgi:hypothetical protein